MAKDTDSASDLVTKVETLDHKKTDSGFQSTEKEPIEEKGIPLDVIAASDDDLECDILGSQPIVCVGINHEDEENVDENEKALLEAKIIELERRIDGIEVAKKLESADKVTEILSLKKKVIELEGAIDSVEFELSKLKNALNISDMNVSKFEKELNDVLQKKLEQNILGDVNGDAMDKDGSSKKHEMDLKLAFGAGAIAVVVGGIVSVYCARRR